MAVLFCELNSKSLKLLWENPNPTIDFGAQNITLSSADYDYLIFEFISGIGTNSGTELVFKGSDVYLNMVGGSGSGSTAKVVSLERQIVRVTDTTFSANNCAQVMQGSSGLTNNNLKPYKIYGGKL